MKKVLITLLTAFTLGLVSCGGASSSASSDEADCIVLREELGSQVYPSYILGYQLNPNCENDCFVAAVVHEEGAKVKISIEENEFMQASIDEHVMNSEDEGVFFPLVKWKNDALLNAEKPGFFNFSAVLEVNGEVVERFNKKVTYRSVNEAVMGYVDEDEEGGYVDCSYLFSQYVNEDNPRIEKILQEIGIGAVGYQNGEDGVYEQMYAIWNYLSNNGTKYSSITDSSNGDQNVSSQYVRFFNQCIDNQQANCIDGTCLLASIYRKMGLEVGIVLVPGHAFLAVDSSDDENAETIFLETTMIGEGGSEDVFNQAIEYAAQEYEEAGEDATIVSISACRQEGYQPINK